MDDVNKLIQQYLDTDLSREERDRLERELLAAPEKMAAFAEVLSVHSDLASASDSTAASQRPATASGPIAAPLLSNQFAGWALAASVAMVAAAVAIYWQSHPAGSVARNESAKQDPVSLDTTSPKPGVVAAYVGRTSNCQWKGEERSEGLTLHEGEDVWLTAGEAELIFDSGARVIAQGPCRLEVDNAQAFTLVLGDVSVEATYGFKVTTPSGIVLDLGTEFGVSVDDLGGSEVHVFKGEVAFQALTAGGSLEGKPLKLPADRACKVTIDGIGVQEFAANEAKFNWRDRPQLADHEVPDLKVREGLALWLAADVDVVLDSEGRVEQWRDLLVGDNETAEDALQTSSQHRPALTPDGINGRPSVRFGDNGTFLVTPPLRTTDEQTAFVVCSVFDRHPDFQQILNYNGPPQRVVPSFGGIVSPAVFEICLRDQDENGVFAICGEVFSGYARPKPQGVVKIVVTAFNRLPLDVPRVVCFRYSLADGEMSLYLNGTDWERNDASEPIAITSRKILGRHPILEGGTGIFQGDLGEVLIYNRALSDGEVHEVSDYLCNRFAISERLKRE